MSAVAGILLANAKPLEAAVRCRDGAASPLTEIWFDVRPLLLLAGVPSILMGVSFPLANALVQQAESLVARRAGGLYLAKHDRRCCRVDRNRIPASSVARHSGECRDPRGRIRAGHRVVVSVFAFGR